MSSCGVIWIHLIAITEWSLPMLKAKTLPTLNILYVHRITVKFSFPSYRKCLCRFKKEVGPNRKALIKSHLFSMAICVVLGKSAKISFLMQSKNYVVSMKSVLTRMIVMKIWYFHEHTGIWPEPIRHQNLYISYRDTFMKQAKLCTMSLNLNTQKSLESRNQDLDHVYHTKYWEFFYSNSNTKPRTLKPKIPIFTGGIHWILPKIWTFSTSLPLFSLWNILFLVLVRMHFPNSAFIYGFILF